MQKLKVEKNWIHSTIGTFQRCTMSYASQEKLANTLYVLDW